MPDQGVPEARRALWDAQAADAPESIFCCPICRDMKSCGYGDHIWIEYRKVIPTTPSEEATDA